MRFSEQQIIRLLLQQDKRAIGVLYDRYGAVLYGILLKLVRSESIALELLQETFLKAWNKGIYYHPNKGTLFNWMLNIARNIAMNRLRQEESMHPEGDIPPNKNQAERQLEQLTQRSISDLDEQYRKLIDLIYFKGYTPEEVREALKISGGSVRSSIRLAIRELRKLFSVQFSCFGCLLWLITM